MPKKQRPKLVETGNVTAKVCRVKLSTNANRFACSLYRKELHHGKFWFREILIPDCLCFSRPFKTAANRIVFENHETLEKTILPPRRHRGNRADCFLQFRRFLPRAKQRSTDMTDCRSLETCRNEISMTT